LPPSIAVIADHLGRRLEALERCAHDRVLARGSAVNVELKAEVAQEKGPVGGQASGFRRI
jgi:hypothetical protein